MSLPVVELKKGREKPLEWRHPWMFSGAVHRVEPGIKPGSLVKVLDASGGCRGVALFGSRTIALKFLTFSAEEIDFSFFVKVLQLARERRERLGLFQATGTDSFRLFFGESDGVPGLIVDRYASALVIQLQEEGLYQFESLIGKALQEVYQDLVLDTLYLKKAEGEGLFIKGNRSGGSARESGMEFSVNWVTGQKTGFFLDQRENRALLRRYVYREEVLNCFCYTGGFSVAALHGGAARVVSIDSSEPALELLEENLRRAQGGDVFTESIRSDVFDYLESAKEEFGVVIVDPPAFVKHRAALEKGIRGYRQLNIAAFKRVRPRGLMMTFSCSQLVSRQDFRRIISEAAVQSGRRISILHELHQAPCHPVSLAFPEAEYLKGYLLLVEDHA